MRLPLRALGSKHKTVADFAAHHGDCFSHQVKWVAGGWIDEQFFFEDPGDARWFFVEGWRNRDFLVKDGITPRRCGSTAWSSPTTSARTIPRLATGQSARLAELSCDGDQAMRGMARSKVLAATPACRRPARKPTALRTPSN